MKAHGFHGFLQLARESGWRVQALGDPTSSKPIEARKWRMWGLRRYPISVSLSPEEHDFSDDDQDPAILNLHEPGPGDLVTIMGVIVAERWRRRGLASRAMKELTAVADKAEVWMEACETPIKGEYEEPGLTTEILVKWLEKFGFERSKYDDRKMARGWKGARMRQRSSRDSCNDE